MSSDNHIGKEYWKRYFHDIKQRKIEENFKSYKEKHKTPLLRTSLTPQERNIIGIKKELLTYKNMLHNEQQKNNKLHGELFSISRENINYKTQLNNIQKQLDKCN
jgi:hypothetical protein